MLPVKYRLSKKKDFERAIRQGAFFSFGDVSLKLAKNSTETTRIGFLVGRKSGHKSSARNAIKRKLRGAFLKEIKKISPGFDIVVFCNYYEREGKKFKLEKNQVKNLLKESGLLK